MIVETYSNTLFLARQTKPRAMTAKDGTFGLQILAYSKPASHVLVPWRVTWFGDDALTFWGHSGASLTPGAAVLVELSKLTLIDAAGRNRQPEMHAHVNSLQLLPSARNTRQDLQTKPPSSAYAASVSSY